MLGEQKIKQLLDSILQRSDADQTEVLVMGQDEQLTRFANNTIHQNVAETNAILTVRVAFGQRVGMATTNDLSAAGLDRAVETATTVAKLQPENPNFAGFPEPRALRLVQAFDAATAAYSPQDRAEQVGSVCRRAAEKKLTASGAFTTTTQELAVANSHGVSAYFPSTGADLVTVVMSDDSAGYAAEKSWRVAQVNVPALGDEAIAKALQSRHPRDFEPGVYTVVLEPYATQDLVAMLAYTGMGALAVQEGRSWMNDRIGQQIMAPSVSIWDDGLDLGGAPLPFDFEGTPKQRVDVVKNGIPLEVVYDTATARKQDGQESTGHALPPALATTYGPMPTNLFMAAGDATLDEMVASTEHGLLITRFNYTRPVHPRDAVITGLTRDGTFLIENGAIAYPVKNLRYTQSYVAALAQVEMIGKELKTLESYIGAQRVPAVKIREFNFTGKTQF